MNCFCPDDCNCHYAWRTNYCGCKGHSTAEEIIHKARLEYLRGELRAERISYAELAELQELAAYIEPGDVELLEAAGIKEAS
jgi:hypothetical protein